MPAPVADVASVHAAHVIAHPERAPARRRQAPPPARLDAPTRIVYGYLPYWEYGPDEVPWTHLTHLAVFSVGADADGSLSSLSRWTGRAADAVRLGHAAGVKVHLCVTQFDPGTLDALLGSASARERLVGNLVTQVRAYGADGVNVDFEGVRAGQRANMVRLVEELMAAGVGEVTLATPAVDWNESWDEDALARLSDGLFIMGYGYHWTGGDPGPNAPLEAGGTWSRWTLAWTVEQYLAAGADPRKIVLGLPLYGQRWPVRDVEAVPGDATGGGSSVVYASAVADAGSRRRWDSASVTPWFPGSSTQTWYDDAESIEAKTRWALLDTGLGGVGFWALGYDENDADLWARMDRALLDAAAADAPDEPVEDTAESPDPSDSAEPGPTETAVGNGEAPRARTVDGAGCATGTESGGTGALAAWGLAVLLRRRASGRGRA